MQKEKLIPDTTFFSFFLYNTWEKEYLKKILKEFYVEVCPKVHKEIDNYAPEDIKKDLHFFNEELDFSGLLKPLFSEGQIEKGEHGVIVLAYFNYNLGIKEFIIVLDDKGARNFMKNNFPYLENITKWTAEFIKDCYPKIFNKEQILDLLDKMGKSTFAIDEDSLNKIIQEIQK